jgi:hypothetical protein
LYCSKRDGGIGIPKFEVFSIGYKFLRNQDPIIQALGEATGLEKRSQQLARKARINLPIRIPNDITIYERTEKKRQLSNWASFSTHWPQIITNEKLWKKTKQEKIEKKIKKRKWRWIRHTLRKEGTVE